MSIVCFPLDAVSGAPLNTGEMLRNTLGALVTKPSSRPIGAVSGVIPGAPVAAIVTATSSTWTVNPFQAILDLEASAAAGPYLASVSTVQTGTVAAANSYARIDLLSLTLADPAEGDGTTTPGLSITYTVGGSGGTAPATPARSFAFAQISVPATGGGSPSTTWVAPFTVAAGGITPAAAGVRPANPVQGQYIDDATSGLLRWNGTAWVSDVTAQQPTCVVYATTAFTIGTSSTAISFGAASINVGGMWSSGTNVTIAVAGTYIIDGKVTYAGSSAWIAGKLVQAQTMVNGSSIEFNNFVGQSAAGITLGSVPVPVKPATVKLNIGDVVTLSGLQNFGGTFSGVTGALYTSMTVRRVGP